MAEAAEVIRASHLAGIRTELFIIVGLPGENDAEFEKTKDFIHAHHDYIDVVKSVNTLHLVHGTELFDNAGEFGLFLPDTDWYYLWKEESGTNDYEQRKRRARELIDIIASYDIPLLEHNLFEGTMV